MSDQLPIAKGGDFWSTWLGRRQVALPSHEMLAEPAEDVDPDTAKVALEQVNKRLDAELALKSATETRAMSLAGQCTTLLTAVAGATLVEANGSQRIPLLTAGLVASACLLLALVLAYKSARATDGLTLPGRLSDELWDDFIAESMKAPEFISRLMIGLQDVMAANESRQRRRANSLNMAIVFLILTVPLEEISTMVPAIVGYDRINYVVGKLRLEISGAVSVPIPAISQSTSNFSPIIPP